MTQAPSCSIVGWVWLVDLSRLSSVEELAEGKVESASYDEAELDQTHAYCIAAKEEEPVGLEPFFLSKRKHKLISDSFTLHLIWLATHRSSQVKVLFSPLFKFALPLVQAHLEVAGDWPGSLRRTCICSRYHLWFFALPCTFTTLECGLLDKKYAWKEKKQRVRK